MARRPARFRGPRRRTGRNVWVNHDVNQIPIGNQLGTKDLLTGAAKDFMLFDTTVVRTIIQNLTWTFDSLAPAGTRRMAVAMLQGHTNLDQADFSNLLVDDVGPAYLGILSRTINVSGVAPVTLEITPPEPVIWKSQRRFKENNQTIWLLHQNITPAADTNQQLTGYIRMLIHIP